VRPLLVEIGCEEIPARMIRAAADDLGARVAAILAQAGLAHGGVTAWGGSRRLAVRVDDVEGRQSDRTEQVLGPPAKAAFAEDGALTPAAVGFARKQGIEPTALSKVETERGAYVGFVRDVRGKTVGELLATTLPASVAAMSFPKTMRWGGGENRWVRPVHWLVALHGADVLDVEVFGVRSAPLSRGHRFLHGNAGVRLEDADQYKEALRAAFVVVDPSERRQRLQAELHARAGAGGAQLVEDNALLEEIADLVEWPGVAAGDFDAAFLALPREILSTTLRHHQKCFSCIRGESLAPTFLGVANTDKDPGGHIRRGNEWVVSGRLKDAQFFWDEDRKVPFASRSEKLASVVFHVKVGSYAKKAECTAQVTQELARRLGVPLDLAECAAQAARVLKNDLTTGLVGEFPELQGVVGGLLLAEEGARPEVHRAVYEHYRPAAAEDPIPESVTGSIVSAADKLDTVAALLGAGEMPSGSKDPFGLRRAANGVFRIVIERNWPLSLNDLWFLCGQTPTVLPFLTDRLQNFLRDRGFTQNEVLAVIKPQVSATESLQWPLADLVARLSAIRAVRGRRDFDLLVDLTKRVQNILTKESEKREKAAEAFAASGERPFVEDHPAAVELGQLIKGIKPRLASAARSRNYSEAVELISGLINPVERFFADVLVIDAARPAVTVTRTEFLAREVRPVLTEHFDLRELAGQAGSA